ncbi:MAG: hypothetical protein KA116_06475 [Proteobacteria bacterium]|nr:hypothetical protein [Pseudomonadota bacterium]
MAQSSRNQLDARWTLWLPFVGRCYFVFLVGKDIRGKKVPENQDDLERRKQSRFLSAIVYASFFSFVVFSSLIALFFVAYLAKSYLGIDLVSHSSPLPNFLKRIGICH